MNIPIGGKSTKRRFLLLLAITTVCVFAIGNVLYLNDPSSVQSLDLSPLQIHDTYVKWKVEFNVSYPEEEDKTRERIFAKNYKRIVEHNATPGVTYTMALNKLAALTEDELRQYYGLKYVKQVSKDRKAPENTTKGPDFLN